ncbi:hypothetical protein RJ640_018300 [Escallonia rubra]|uniref:Uncharacterized protein n=1 Tax=Escallonia rubra TaxID=112253 RepID=A0AA88S5J3_9ASTE|nr:hypothetical protein RJ640_018300 [Escallonia rubra]
MRKESKSFSHRHVRDPCRSFGRRCGRLVKEQRARFYILRRCVTMLVCWQECGDRSLVISLHCGPSQAYYLANLIYGTPL